MCVDAAIVALCTQVMQRSHNIDGVDITLYDGEPLPLPEGLTYAADLLLEYADGQEVTYWQGCDPTPWYERSSNQVFMGVLLMDQQCAEKIYGERTAEDTILVMTTAASYTNQWTKQ
eukprot:COSAG02_NODE_392_length_23227_cov_30.763620_23_plen_117_part_00